MLSGPVFDVAALCLAVCIAAAVLIGKAMAVGGRREWPEYPTEPLPEFEAGVPVDAPFPVDVEIGVIQALYLARSGLPCPPVLADEIAARRAKAGQT